MIARSTIRLGLVLCLLSLFIQKTFSGDYDHAHTHLDRLLKQHVVNGWVDYQAIKANQKELDLALDAMANVSAVEFKRWDKQNRLAFLINLYNAATLKLIVTHYPVKSIKDIGSFISGPWKQKMVRLFGETVTLDYLEHEVIRKEYSDARVHFALVCAAKSCPPLRSEAYVGKRVDEQMDDQGRIFLAQRGKNRVEVKEKTLLLSPIFKWFSGDFENQSGSVKTFILPYLNESDRIALKAGNFKVSYSAYDWSLNESKSK